MKVCIVYYSFFNPLMVRDAKAHLDRGDEVDVICYGLSNERPLSFGADLRVHILMNRKFDEKGPLSYFARIAYFFLLATAKISRLHFGNRFDLVHIVSPPDFMVFAAIVPKLLGAKIILNVHDIVPEFYMRKFRAKKTHFIIRMLKIVEKICCRFADHVITVTDIWRDKLIERAGISKDKCTVLMNVPDHQIIDKYKKEEKKNSPHFRLLYPGNLGEHFGVETLVRAMPIVVAEIPSCRLEIYGDGPKKAYLQELAKELSAEHVINFNKYVAVDELYSIMKQMDIGVVPTLDGVFAGEALSTKSLEFLAMGIPVVISRTRINLYYYDDSMVMFFRQGDHKDLADCIVRLYKNPGKREELVQNARAFTERHNWKKYREDYSKTVEGLFR